MGHYNLVNMTLKDRHMGIGLHEDMQHIDLGGDVESQF
jgi:hypothetical protein